MYKKQSTSNLQRTSNVIGLMTHISGVLFSVYHRWDTSWDSYDSMTTFFDVWSRSGFIPVFLQLCCFRGDGCEMMMMLVCVHQSDPFIGKWRSGLSSNPESKLWSLWSFSSWWTNGCWWKTMFRSLQPVQVPLSMIAFSSKFFSFLDPCYWSMRPYGVNLFADNTVSYDTEIFWRKTIGTIIPKRFIIKKKKR